MGRNIRLKLLRTLTISNLSQNLWMKKMREVQQSFPTTQSSTRIAILAAMNISDELMTLRKNSDSGDLDIEEKLSTLIEFIDDSLNH